MLPADKPGLNDRFWINAHRDPNRGGDFYYGVGWNGQLERETTSPVSDSLYVHVDNLLKTMSDGCATLQALEVTPPNKYSWQADSDNCDTATHYVFCMMNMSTTEFTTPDPSATTAAPATTTTVASGPIPGENLPKMPCIPPLARRKRQADSTGNTGKIRLCI